MKWITTAILVGLLAGCQCVAPPSPDIYRECAESAAATRHYLYYDHFQTALEYDAYLTWKNYNGQGWPNDALYMWNGEEVGTGGDGFVIVLRKMRQLPPYSRILVFPTRRTTGDVFTGVPKGGTTGGNAFYERPWVNSYSPSGGFMDENEPLYEDLLNQVLVERKLVLLLVNKYPAGTILDTRRNRAADEATIATPHAQ